MRTQFLAAPVSAQNGLTDAREAEVPLFAGDIAISPALEAVLAPAVLPRSWLNQQILLAIQEVRMLCKRHVQRLQCAAYSLADLRWPAQFRLRLPLQTRPPGATSRSMPVGGGEYLLTYLDADLLIGRAEQGVFIFSRDE